MSPLEVRRNVGSFFVRHPTFKSVESEIHEIIKLGRADVEADCVLVTSPSGTGKTTLFRRLKRVYDPEGRRVRRQVALPKSPTEVSAPHVPVLFFECDTLPRPIAMVQGFLKELGDPNWDKGRFHDCCHKLDDMLDACGTTTIVLDEVQRLVDQTGVITSQTILEELKRIHGRHGLSLVFLGLGRIKYILEEDAQLRDRWSLELRLQGFQCFRYKVDGDTASKVVDEEQWRTWQSILRSLQEKTGLHSDKLLSSDDYAERIYLATAGVLRRLKTLLKRSLMLLAEQGQEEVNLDVLALAFDDIGKSRGPNPFRAETTDTLPLPIIDDDYKLKPPSKQRRVQKAADARSPDAGAAIINALRR